MFYREEYEYFKKEMLEKDKQGNYFTMANEPLAEEYYEEGIKEFPNLRMYQFGFEQFFCIGDKAREKLRKLMKSNITKRESEIAELYSELEKINKGMIMTESYGGEDGYASP